MRLAPLALAVPLEKVQSVGRRIMYRPSRVHTEMNRRLLQRIATVLLLVAGVISLVIWSVLPVSIPARGTFHEFELDTTVDSEAAKY